MVLLIEGVLMLYTSSSFSKIKSYGSAKRELSEEEEEKIYAQ